MTSLTALDYLIMTMPGSTMPFAIGMPNGTVGYNHAQSWDEAQERFRRANEKSIELLKSWLSPEQLEQYETNGSFDVRGSDGGRYRIGPPSPFNIRVIEPEGHCGSAYCVVPKDISPAGDIQLAQKIALETDEEGTIRQANKANNSFGTWDHAYGVARAAISDNLYAVPATD